MLPTKLYKKRQFIYTEGEIANEMYVIISGSVKIIKNVKNNIANIAVLEKSSFLGEVALFRGEKHSSTAVAETDIELAVINKETFDQQLKVLPNWFQSVIRSMADRLHHASEQLSIQAKELHLTAELAKNKPTEPQADKKKNNNI